MTRMGMDFVVSPVSSREGCRRHVPSSRYRRAFELLVPCAPLCPMLAFLPRSGITQTVANRGSTKIKFVNESTAVADRPATAFRIIIEFDRNSANIFNDFL